MNQSERAQIGELWIAVASMYGKEIGREALKLMLNAVSDLSADSVSGALHGWVKTAKNRSYPLPGDIREILTPVVDPDAMAREIAGRCVEAISKFGWPQPDKAHAYIGDEGWSVIQANGGWMYFCEQHGVEINPGQFFAQARDRVRDQIAFGRTGIETAYLEKKDEQGLKRLGSILQMKQLPGNQNEPA